MNRRQIIIAAGAALLTPVNNLIGKSDWQGQPIFRAWCEFSEGGFVMNTGIRMEIDGEVWGAAIRQTTMMGILAHKRGYVRFTSNRRGEAKRHQSGHKLGIYEGPSMGEAMVESMRNFNDPTLKAFFERFDQLDAPDHRLIDPINEAIDLAMANSYIP